MQPYSRIKNSKDIETAAESIISSSCFLRPVIESMCRDARKTVAFQQADIGSFDNDIEKKK